MIEKLPSLPALLTLAAQWECYMNGTIESLGDVLQFIDRVRVVGNGMASAARALAKECARVERQASKKVPKTRPKMARGKAKKS